MNSRKSDLIQGYSKGLNLSPEGLRFYERKGIVHPVRDPESGYRYYNFSDTVAVTTCRKMCCYGYTLEEASESFKNQSFDEQEASFKEHKAAFQKELERQQLILEHMEESEETIEDALNHLNEPVRAKLPALSFLPTRISQESIRDRGLLKQINAWNSFQPFPEIVLLNNGKEMVTGIVMDQKYLKLLDLPWQEEFESTEGISLSMIQTIEELEKGDYLSRAEQILNRKLAGSRAMNVVLSATMKSGRMQVLSRMLIPD